jgi:hypothetical protein
MLPLPPEGLPAGWSMEQWEEYGQEWIDSQSNQHRPSSNHHDINSIRIEISSVKLETQARERQAYVRDRHLELESTLMRWLWIFFGVFFVFLIIISPRFWEPLLWPTEYHDCPTSEYDDDFSSWNLDYDECWDNYNDDAAVRDYIFVGVVFFIIPGVIAFLLRKKITEKNNISEVVRKSNVLWDQGKHLESLGLMTALSRMYDMNQEVSSRLKELKEKVDEKD